MKNIFSILILTLFFIPLPIFAQKQEIVVWNYYLSPPFYISKNNGLAYDFVSLLNEKFKDKYVFKLRNLPRIRLNRELNLKENGILLFVNWKWMGKGSKKSYYWTEKILKDKNIIISHINNQLILKDDTTFDNLIFGGIRGRKYKALESFFNTKQLKRYDVDSEEQVLNMIIKNRVDITTQPFSIATAISKKMHIRDKLFFSPNPLFSFNRYIMITPSLQHIKLPLNQFIKKLSQNSKWQKILQKYDLEK